MNTRIAPTDRPQMSPPRQNRAPARRRWLRGAAWAMLVLGGVVSIVHYGVLGGGDGIFGGARRSWADETKTSPDDDAWAQRGREAFHGELGSAPWYDAKNDSLQSIPIETVKKRDHREPSSSSGLAKYFGLGAKIVAYSLLAALLLGLAWLLVIAFLAREKKVMAKTKSATSKLMTADRIDELPIGVAGAPSDFLAMARRLYEEGRFSEAIVYLFGHELIELDRRNLIRLARGKTNHQYLRELSGKADLRALLGRTVDRFERAFFGAERLDRQSVDVCWNDLPSFAALVGQETS